MLASKEISKDNIEYLTVANPRAGRFYPFPKIHKPGNPGCPIVTQPKGSQSLLTYITCL